MTVTATTTTARDTALRRGKFVDPEVTADGARVSRSVTPPMNPWTVGATPPSATG